MIYEQEDLCLDHAGGATLLWGLSYTIQSISAENLGPFTLVFLKEREGSFFCRSFWHRKRRS
ncbi:MAG: hypothetical protein II568_06300, partial [Erysipelotrichaceae bacterium]|nr:hypothetical protein [Erysipelotrichaceae bacterium]